MPNLANAKKALRQSIKSTQRNKLVKAEIHSLRVKFRKMIVSKQLDEAKEIARIVGKKLDKAVSKKMLKINTAARYKSRIMQKINALAKV